MQFTKFEKKIMENVSNEKFGKDCKILLWVGILCIIIAFLVFFWNYKKAQTINAFFHSQLLQIKNYNTPKTELEKELRRSLIEKAELAAEGWHTAAKERTLSASSVWSLVGVFSILISVYAKKISILIKKIKNL